MSADPVRNADAIAAGAAVPGPSGTADATAATTTAATTTAATTTAAGTTAATTTAAATLPPPDAPATDRATAMEAATAAAPALPVRRPRTVFLAFGRRVLRFAVAAALLVAGVYAGWQVHVSSQPVTVIQGDPAVVGVPTPPVVVELANAIGADDADAIRAALAPEIFSSYTADLQNFSITQVLAVDILGTFADGPRTATGLVIHGRDPQRNAFSVNLVVLTEGGAIVRLR
jgi:hypothetical protein